MPILPIPSLNALVTKAVKTVKNTAPIVTHKRHLLHYFLKSLGSLPTPVLNRFNRYLKASTAEQYPHADAHLRLFMAYNNKIKRPLHITQLPKLRQKYAADAVGLQAPEVWQQPSDNKKTSTSKLITNTDTRSVSWQDKIVANADDGDMTIRCYQAGSGAAKKFEQNTKQHLKNIHGHNPDQVVMLFFHGGGFCIGDLDTHHEFCHAICTKTGWAVVSVDYRLAPEYPAPTALRDCIAAYVWLTEHCHTLNALPSRIVLSGDSAGGCLASLVAQQVTTPIDTQWQNLNIDTDSMVRLLQNLPRPLAQLPLYPVIDIAAEHPSWALYGQGLLLDHNDIEVFDAAYLQHSHLTQTNSLISPMYGENTHMCPSYIVVAELDVLRDEGLIYAEHLQDNGINAQTYTVLGAPHGFIHLMSVHKGIGRETDYIIHEFADFVHQLCTETEDAV